MCDTLVIFDRVRHIVNVVSHFRSDVKDPKEVEKEYRKAAEEIETTLTLLNDDHIPAIPQVPLTTLGEKAVSNVGKDGYMGFVSSLKHDI
ncbi:hypothetical protein G6F68_017988 [Rhizopus microsporus]|nr:hypothetical protein G6F68_017988 [Rhizopus microsporus]